MSSQRAVRARKIFNLVIPNADMGDILKIVESLKNLGLLIDGATETVKHQIKREGGFVGTMMVLMATSLIALMASSLIQATASSLINTITVTGLSRARKGQEGGFRLFLLLLLIMKVLAKGVMNENF